MVQHLYQCDRQGALKRLCSLAEIPWSEKPNTREVFGTSPYIQPVRLLPLYSAEYHKAKTRLEWLELYRHGLDVALQILRCNVKLGRVALSEFYAKEQIYLYELEELDPRIAEAKHKTNKIRRYVRRNGNSKTYC